MWQKLFDGRIEERPVVLKESDGGDGSRTLRVETSYSRDNVHSGDVRDLIIGAVSTDGELHVDASTPEELERRLIEQAGFPRLGPRRLHA